MTKYIIALLIAALFGDGTTAAVAPRQDQPVGVAFLEGSLDDALAKAEKADKLMFVYAYASWCESCRRMSHEVFARDKAANYFNNRFVNYKFDVEKGEGVALAQSYGVDRFPSFLILDSQGRLLGKMIGGSPIDDFIARIDRLKVRADSVASALGKEAQGSFFENK